MFFRKEIIEGSIDEIGTQLVQGHGTKYSFIRVDGKMHRNLLTEDFLDSFIHLGRTVRLGIRRTKTGQNMLVSVQENSEEIHKLPIREVMSESLILGGCFSFLVFLATFLIPLILTKAKDPLTLLQIASLCGASVFVYYFWSLLNLRHILQNSKPSASFLNKHPDFK